MAWSKSNQDYQYFAWLAENAREFEKATECEADRTCGKEMKMPFCSSIHQELICLCETNLAPALIHLLEQAPPMFHVPCQIGHHSALNLFQGLPSRSDPSASSPTACWNGRLSVPNVGLAGPGG